VPAKEPLQKARHSDSGAGADATGYLHISVASFWMVNVRFGCQHKEPIHALQGEVSRLVVVLSASHSHLLE
jgi:hypothetical protein